MVTSPCTVRADEKMAAALAALMAAKVSALPVLDAGGGYAGLVSLRGFFGELLPRAARLDRPINDLQFVHETLSDLKQRFRAIAGDAVSQHLDAGAPTVGRDTSLMEAMLLFHRGHTVLPVVEGEVRRLAGVITRHEMLQAIAE